MVKSTNELAGRDPAHGRHKTLVITFTVDGMPRKVTVAENQQIELLPGESTESQPQTEIINWAKGHYDSIHGRISSDWKWENGAFTWAVTVPPNTTATVYMPENAASLTESGKPIAKASGVKFLRTEKGRAIYELQSGDYYFKTK